MNGCVAAEQIGVTRRIRSRNAAVGLQRLTSLRHAAASE